MLAKIHHALIDGVSSVEMTRLTSDFTPDAPPPAAPERSWNPPPLPTPAEAFIEATNDYLKAQLDSTSESLQQLMRNPAEVAERTRQMNEANQTLAREFARPAVSTPWNAALVSSQRNVAWSKYPFADFRAIRTAVGGTINDVVLVILSEAAARYLKHHGYNAAGGEFRIFCPVNVRRPEEEIDLGNRVSAMFPMVPAEPMDLLERCRKVTAETLRIKEAALAQLLDRMGSMGNPMPPALLGWMERLNRFNFDAASALVRMAGFKPQPDGPALTPTASFLASNVPGFQVPTYFCGRQLLDMIGFAPLSGNIGYGVGITSYNQQIYFFLTGEPNLLPDIDLMKKLCDEVFEELKKRASDAAQSKQDRVA
jgi:WS/DGAT/MGAT family acyltransferase